MSTMYMVRSSLVFLACHINMVLLTILFLFNMPKPTEHSILRILQVIFYAFGLLFNGYVVLYASRKWELIVKHYGYSKSYMRMMQQEIKHNLINSIKVAAEQIVIAVGSVIEAYGRLSLGDPEISNYQEEIQLSSSKEIQLPSSKEEIKLSSSKETDTKVETISERTPEVKLLYNLRHASRPQSDPIKSTVKSDFIRSPSPELLKNKIFQSRMKMTCDTPLSSKVKRK